MPCRLEKFEVEYWYSRAKVGGTFVCFSGAVAMSCYRSNSNSPNLKSKEPKLLMKHLDKDTYSDWILGCFYLLAAVVLQLQVISFQIKLYYWRSSLWTHKDFVLCQQTCENTMENHYGSNRLLLETSLTCKNCNQVLHNHSIGSFLACFIPLCLIYVAY